MSAKDISMRSLTSLGPSLEQRSLGHKLSTYRLVEKTDDGFVATPTAEPPSSADSGQHEKVVQYPGGLKLAIIIIAVELAMLPAVMDMSILATAIPKITDAFHRLDDISWYASAYFLTVAASQSMWGKAYKFFDLKRVFLGTMMVFLVGSVVSAVAKSSTTVIIGRAITGLGAAGVLAGCFTIMAFSVGPERRPAFSGILSATYGVGTSIGPIIGGRLADQISWRWCFYINLPIGGAAGVMILLAFKTPEIARHKDDAGATWSEKLRQMDIVGSFTIMAGVVCLLLSLQWGGVDKSWHSPDVIGVLVGFVLIAVLFVFVEWYQGDRAMLVPHIMKKRYVWVGALVSVLLGGAEFTLLYYLPIYFQTIKGLSAEASGVRTLAFILPKSVTTLAFGFVISAVGHFTPFIIVGAGIATIGGGLLTTLAASSSESAWVGYQVLAGIGMGLSFKTPISAAQALAEHRDLAATTAILLFMQTFGGAIMVSLAGSIFENILIKTLPSNAPGVDSSAVIAAGASGLDKFSPQEQQGIVASYTVGLRDAYILITVLAGCGTVVSLGMPWTSVKMKKKALGH